NVAVACPPARASSFMLVPLLPPTLSFFFLSLRPPPRSTLFPYTTLFRSRRARARQDAGGAHGGRMPSHRVLPNPVHAGPGFGRTDRKSTRLNSSHVAISYAVFCLKKKTWRRACT